MDLNMRSPVEVLTKYWGYEGFRPMQEDIISSVLERKDTLALLPTGGGKSICFQVPALCFPGLTLVISPLKALMKDQVERLNKLKIPATYLSSDMSRKQLDSKLQGAMDGRYKLLYLAPERIISDMFQFRLTEMKVSLLAVDEAHCISQWGYDFRPSYLQIATIREILPDIGIVALTASATTEVQHDIMRQLNMQHPKIFKKSFKRKNLRYFVLEEENVTQRIISITRRTKGSGIIYVRTRKRTTALSEILAQQGISIAPYHGGLPASVRNKTQQDWIDNHTRIIVATNAFGMGIDKPDVRFVIHLNLPGDLESYYQEAGRGGRDEQTALAISFNNPIDIGELTQWHKRSYPNWETVQQHYELLCQHFHLTEGHVPANTYLFDINRFVEEDKVHLLSFYHSLKILHREGMIDFQEDHNDFGYVRVIVNPQELLSYKQQHPIYTQLLNYILRSCGGEVYSREVRFLPLSWTHRLEMSEEKLTTHLEKLVQHEIIEYMAPTHQPTLRFLQSKDSFSKRKINWEKYTFLKEQASTRLKKLIAYAENTSLCRSLFIQQYFGEKDQIPCGKCDICIGRYKTNLSSREFHQIKEAIIEYIKIHPGTQYRELVLRLTTANPGKKEKVLRYLIDKKIVIADMFGRLSVK